MTQIDIAKIIAAIEVRQPVLNKADLTEALQKHIICVANLLTATQTQLAFLSQSKYLEQLVDTKAGVILISHKFYEQAYEINASTCYIVVPDAYLAYACVSGLFKKPKQQGVHPTATIATSAHIAPNVHIGAYAIIGEHAVICEEVSIGAHCVIGDGVQIGKQSEILPSVVVAHDCVIGERVCIHSHASIGSEGFGFASFGKDQGLKWQSIAQLGRVIIGNDVRIGSHTCIDRGAIDDTIIGDCVIIDNLVQIAHNVQIGSGTAIAAKVGIAGSTVIGKNCIIGGAVGIVGHLKIADSVTLTARTLVISDISESGTYSSGTVAMPSMKWRRAAARFRQMGEKSYQTYTHS